MNRFGGYAAINRNAMGEEVRGTPERKREGVCYCVKYEEHVDDEAID